MTLAWRAALALAAAGALYVLLAPAPPVQADVLPLGDKLAHVAIFATIAVLARLAFPAAAPARVVLIVAACGLAVEPAQALTGRTVDALDAAANVVGSLAGLTWPRR